MRNAFTVLLSVDETENSRTSRASLDCVEIFFFDFVFFTGRERALDSLSLIGYLNVANYGGLH